MIDVRNIRRYSKIRYLLLLLLVSVSMLQFFAPTAHAYGEKYSWVNAMTINASEGRYGDLTYTFKADRTYTPGRDDIPDFTVFDQINDSEDGCVFGASLKFSGKDASKATFDPDISILTCSSDTVAKYDVRVALLNASNQNSNPSKNRTITVRSQITKGYPYPNKSDVISLKELRSGNVVGTKNVSSSDAYADAEYSGFKTSFGRLSNDLAYTACSKSLNLCESTIANPQTGTPDDERANQITISKTVEEPDGSSGTTCAVDGIGWIVCPVINFMADLNDNALTFLGDEFLSITPGFFESGGASEAAWKSFRDIANVAFVIAFLLIIYSQITGGGITNYGIKKLLPKIIIAAILVNTSYFICQLAVDLSNIAGNSVASLMDTIPTSTADQATQAVTWKEAAGKTLAIAGGVVIALVLLSVIGPAALLALALVVLILVARKALIILLVVISPLAFVAYLLPNTEQYFKKWWKIFSTLLLLYPIIGLIFGASQLAAKVIVAAGEDNELTQLTALGVMAIPLFAIPLVLKGVTSTMGALGSKLSNWQDKATGAAGKGAKEKLKRRGENIEARMAGSGNRYARLAGGFRNRRAFGRKSIETDTARRQQEALTKHVLNNPGSYNPRQLAEAKSASLKEYNEEVGREKSTMSDLEHGDLMKIVKDKDASEERRAAAAGMIGSRSFRKGHQELLDYIGDESHVGADGKMDSVMKTVQQQTAYDMKDQPIGMGDADKSALGEGRFTKPRGANAAGTKRTVSQEGLLQRLHEGKVSEQAFASMNPDDLSLVQSLKSGGHLTPEAQATIDKLLDRLNKPEMATVYASSKENARKIHATLHS